MWKKTLVAHSNVGLFSVHLTGGTEEDRVKYSKS